MPNVKLDVELQVTTPNEPGILHRVLGTLANSGINLRALLAYTLDNKGIFHILCTDHEKAFQCLQSMKYEVKQVEVVTILIDDRIGAGAEVGALLGNAAIDIKYCYGSSSGTGKALLVLNTNNNQKAIQTLK
ncbi:ACT domain-containing protein [Candidatus Aminicenantes bacterium AC-334-K16]|nr:ACT domain-containing protein [Candidatus Aminicenantes bacterium AC-334-K16]